MSSSNLIPLTQPSIPPSHKSPPHRFVVLSTTLAGALYTTCSSFGTIQIRLPRSEHPQILIRPIPWTLAWSRDPTLRRKHQKALERTVQDGTEPGTIDA